MIIEGTTKCTSCGDTIDWIYIISHKGTVVDTAIPNDKVIAARIRHPTGNVVQLRCKCPRCNTTNLFTYELVL